MISPWAIYWITRLDSIIVFLDVLTVFVFMVGGVTVVAWVAGKYDSDLSEDDGKHCCRIAKMWAWPSISIGLFLAVLLVLIPTTKEAAAIYVIPAIVNNEKVQAEASELYELTKDYLKLQIEENAE